MLVSFSNDSQQTNLARRNHGKEKLFSSAWIILFYTNIFYFMFFLYIFLNICVPAKSKSAKQYKQKQNLYECYILRNHCKCVFNPYYLCRQSRFELATRQNVPGFRANSEGKTTTKELKVLLIRGSAPSFVRIVNYGSQEGGNKCNQKIQEL